LLLKNIKIKIYISVIFPGVLYRCETWSLTMSEKHRLRAFEKRVLRKISGPKKDKVTGGWRRLNNNTLYSSPNNIWVIKSRRLRWVTLVTCMEGRTGAYMVLVGRPGDKRPLGRPTHRWEYNNTMDLQEVAWGGIDWIVKAQHRDRWQSLVNAVMSLCIL
jgi:hypothetical protein